MSEANILDLLLSVTHTLQADQDRELDRRGLTTARTHLMWVVFHGGPATQVQLAEALAVTPRNITALVDGLEATGLARREPHPTDRRAVLVHLTERGLSIMETMNAEHSALGSDLIAGLDDATVATTIRGLETIRANLERLIADHEAARAE
jgi:DNA-binding MarR family transcriptional regulator